MFIGGFFDPQPDVKLYDASQCALSSSSFDRSKRRSQDGRNTPVALALPRACAPQMAGIPEFPAWTRRTSPRLPNRREILNDLVFLLKEGTLASRM